MKQAGKHLHNWFIPHKGNKYKPHALQHRHLAFHAFLALALKGVFVVSIFALPSSLLLASSEVIEIRSRIIALTNGVRNSVGVPPLSVNAQLTNAAMAKSEHMSSLEYFSHFGPDGKKHVDFLKDAGYNFAISGENLAVGFTTPDGVVNGWKKSPTHYANMIDPSYTETGVGVVPGEYKNKHTNYIAQFFSSAKTGSIQEPIELTSQLDTENSFVSSERVNDEISLKAVAFATENTKEIEVFVNEVSFGLEQDLVEQGKWVGETTISKESAKSLRPLVLATAVSKNDSGEVGVQDLSYEKIQPLLPGTFETYQYYKKNPSSFLQMISNVIHSYYQLIILVLLVALTLGIVIERRKQYPHSIASSVGVISLLILLLKF